MSILVYSLEETSGNQLSATVSKNRSKVIFKRSTTHHNRKGDNVWVINNDYLDSV